MDSLKERLTLRWVQRRLGQTSHERRVAGIASAIFDLTRPLHRLNGPHRRILRLGCLVHDVGRWLDDRDHPSIGAKLIEKDRTLPLSDRDRRRARYLTRYHRGAVPRATFDDILIPGDGRKAMLLILAILRAADALDNRQMEPPRLEFAACGRKLTVDIELPEMTAKARRVFKRRKKFRLLEELLGITIDMRIAVLEGEETA
jgi:exopolyphosphatase/pppGpp-phosphohydrolase